MKLAGALRPSLNCLVVFVPLSLALELAHARQLPWASATLVFISSCLAIIPLAGWMGKATEHLADRVGAGIGGLLNATFGNAAELIIAILFLLAARHASSPEKVQYYHSVVKASLTGSIIGNVLLVLGASLFAGGLRYKTQQFNAVAARSGATMLCLAAVSLVVPAVFARMVEGQKGAGDVLDLSVQISILLLVIYASGLLFSLKTHKHLFLGEVGEEVVEVECAAHPEARWSLRKSVVVLLIAAALVALMSELLVGSVEEASHALGMSNLFIGVVVVAIIGNAAEHSTAVMMAMRDRMDLALGISIGSSIQIALFVAPVLVLVSHLLGQPMNLVFGVAEVLSVLIAVAIVSQISGDGESNWLEGLQLLSVYAILGMLFYHL